MLQLHARNLLGEDEAQTELAVRVSCGMGGSFVVHLCQRGLYRMQPEGHVHGAVQRASGGQLRVGLFYPPYPPIQGAEAVVAVGLERAHTEFIGQGQGLPVVVALKDGSIMEREFRARLIERTNLSDTCSCPGAAYFA
jgi:hypothetical protein